MRFLLYRQTAAPKRVVNSTVAATTAAAAATALGRGTKLAPATRITSNDPSSSSSSSPTTTTSTTTTFRSWGQQCSPNCGCVVRFEANTISTAGATATAVQDNHHQHQPVLLSYTAKRILLHPQDGKTTVLLTNKGRPMWQACTCTNLHHLASTLVQYYNNKQAAVNSNTTTCSWKQQAYSDLEFQQTRASAAFGRTVLSAQGLVSSSSSNNKSKNNNMLHCFDLVEEAWTALIKGYLPQPRRQQQQQLLRTTATAAVTQQQQQQRYGDYENEEREFFPTTYPEWESSSSSTFFWNHPAAAIDNDIDAYDDPLLSFPSSSSTSSSSNSHSIGWRPTTLSMFDLHQLQQQQEQEEYERQQQAARQKQLLQQQPPLDWQSYVDLVWYEQEQWTA